MRASFGRRTVDSVPDQAHGSYYRPTDGVSNFICSLIGANAANCPTNCIVDMIGSKSRLPESTDSIKGLFTQHRTRGSSHRVRPLHTGSAAPIVSRSPDFEYSSLLLFCELKPAQIRPQLGLRDPWPQIGLRDAPNGVQNAE